MQWRHQSDATVQQPAKGVKPSDDLQEIYRKTRPLMMQPLPPADVGIIQRAMALMEERLMRSDALVEQRLSKHLDLLVDRMDDYVDRLEAIEEWRLTRTLISAWFHRAERHPLVVVIAGALVGSATTALLTALL